MQVFNSPQDPYLQEEFIQMLNTFLPIKYYGEIPTIAGKTYFWSDVRYRDINQQYYLNPSLHNVTKDFFIKYASSYSEASHNYSASFRNQLKKSKKYNLNDFILLNKDESIIMECYKIYRENMQRIGTVSFKYDFFRAVIGLSFSNVLVICGGNNEILSFGILLGNSLFIQSSTILGKQLCANNFFYDTLMKIYENHDIFLGIASRNNVGLSRFKYDMGANAIPCASTGSDISEFVSQYFRGIRFIQGLGALVGDKIPLKYLLPY